MTVGELLSRISSRELTEWQAYYSLDPFGEDRADLRAGIIAATTANMLRAKGAKGYKPQDFMPRFEKPRQDWRDQLEIVKTLNTALGGNHGNSRQLNSEPDGKNSQL